MALKLLEHSASTSEKTKELSFLLLAPHTVPFIQLSQHDPDTPNPVPLNSEHRTEHEHDPTTAACPLAHFIPRGSASSDRLVLGSAPLRALSRTCSKGACPLAFPPPRPFRGAGEVVLARSQGNRPPKLGPHLFSPLTSGNRRE